MPQTACAIATTAASKEGISKFGNRTTFRCTFIAAQFSHFASILALFVVSASPWRQWYPVLAVDHADPGRTQAVQLLGKDLVVWQNADGRWSCFDDRCPHRAAPLTEGRVEKDGSLLCAYHAWRFDADGKCLSIPQSGRGGKDESQPAACAKVYPTQVAQGVIWVWGENGPNAGIESALATPPLVPEMDDAEGIKSGKVVAADISHRDLPYGWDTLMENLLDPSHVVVAHHGIIGDRSMASPIELVMIDPGATKGGFTFGNFNSQLGGETGSISFTSPCLVTITDKLADGTLMKLILYGIPTRPGWSRLVGRQLSVAPEKGDSKKVKNIVDFGIRADKLPAWFQHVMGHKFMNQDMVFLHHQEKILASAGYDSSTYGRAVHTPTSADRAVLALRKWIYKFTPNGPSWDKGCDPKLPPREYNRKVLYDDYENHTKKCTTCMGALEKVNQGLKLTKTSAVVSLSWAILRGARALSKSAVSAPVLSRVTAKAMLPGLAITLASIGTIKILETVRQMFYMSEYHHQDNN